MNNCKLFKWQMLLIILLISTGGFNGFAQEKSLPLDPAVRTGKLANGFTYYIRHNTEPKNRAVFYLANKVGSILETDKQRGLAHFMEHMSFNGTTHYPKNQLIDYLQKAGVRFGADINAYTNFDETVYQLPLPTDNPEIIKNGLQILRDWAQEASLETSEINKERGVVLEEKRLGKGASERMQLEYMPKLMNGSRYASRMPIGTDDVLINFKPETIRSFYKDWYRPDLQAIIVVGDIDVDAMERDIKEKFADLKKPAHEKPRTKYSIALTGKNQFIRVTDKEMTATVAQVFFKQPKSEQRNAIEYRRAIERSLINQMLSGRYSELFQKPDPDFLAGSASIGPMFGLLDAYTLSVATSPSKDKFEKGFKSVWRETVRAKKFGFTEAELSRAKINYKSRIDLSFKERDKTPSSNYVQVYLQHFLNETSAPGILKEYDLIQKYLPEITLQELNNLTKSYIKDTDRDILLMAADKDKAVLPDEATVNGWIAAVESEDLQAYSEVGNAKKLLNLKPVSGKIVSEKLDKEKGITTITLSNGVKVVLKPTTFKNNDIQFYGFSEGGTSLYSDADYQSAANSANIIGSFGVGNYKANDLSRFLTGKNLNINIGIGERTQTVSGAAVIEDLPLALELLYGYFTEPRKDKVQFESIIARSKSFVANRGSDPGSVFQDTMSAVLGSYNIRRTGPTIAKVEEINLDRVYEIYKERFGDANGFTFVLVGSFDVDNIKPLLEQFLGALPSTQKITHAKDLIIPVPKGQISKTVYMGSEPKATVSMIFSGSFDYNQRNNLTLRAMKEVLNIRLTERLREEESGVYSPSVSILGAKYPEPNYTFRISFGCSPENVNKLMASALDEVNKLKVDGPQLVNIEKFIAEERRQREISLNTNEYWVAYLLNCLQTGQDFDTMDSFNSLLDKISPASLKDAAQKYLSGDNLIKFVLLPAKDADKKEKK